MISKKVKVGKILHNLSLVMLPLCMGLILLLNAASVKVKAEGLVTATSGTFGMCSELSWTMDEKTKTITITGEDFPMVKHNFFDNKVFNATFNSSVEHIKFDKCVLKGDISEFFAGLEELKDIDFSGLTISNLVVMQEVFYGCSSLTSLDLSDWDVSNVRKDTGMISMFVGCDSLTTLKTPKIMGDASANLPGIFVTPSGQETTVMSKEFAGMTLTKKGAEVQPSDDETEKPNIDEGNSTAGNGTNGTLVQDADGAWRYYVNDVLQSNYNGYVLFAGSWWAVAGGQAYPAYTGLWGNDTQGWWYAENGCINTDYNGYVSFGDSWWAVAGGRVYPEYTGLWGNATQGWWYAKNGRIDFTYNGTAEFAGVNWNVVNGQVVF